MSYGSWRTALVLGGVRSGSVTFAESLAAESQAADPPAVRYVTTGVPPGEAAPQPEGEAAAQPGEAAGLLSGQPQQLIGLIGAAKPDEVLLVDDLGGWVAALGADARATAVKALAAAIRDSQARVVVVSPEVGSADPGVPLTDELAAANRVLADACDAVVLVVAGQPLWLKSRDARRAPAPVSRAWSNRGRADRTTPGPTRGVIKPGMDLPMPDEEAGAAARARLATLDLPGAGLGTLADTVAFAAATQGTATPQPWRSAVVLLLHADHAGGSAAGDSPAESARRAQRARTGDSPLAVLATEAGASLRVVEALAARAIESGDALTADEVAEALEQGWQLADDAVDSGADLLVIGACGAGVETAAAAVIASMTSAEAVKVLGRVVSASGHIDDDAWMVRCGTLRDALHRTRSRPRGAVELLAGLGGGDIAVATGVLLGAAARRTPVLLDGPAGVAAGLVSRELGGSARHWCLLPDDGAHPGVRQAADALDLHPVLDLRLGLGEGATALAALPLLRLAVTLAGAPAAG